MAAYLRSVTGEPHTPRRELLARIGEADTDADEGNDTEAVTDARADEMMQQVDEIMRDAEASGTDPTERLREVVGASVMQQIVEGYNKSH